MLDIVRSKPKLALVQYHAEQFALSRQVALASIGLAKARAFGTNDQEHLIHEWEETQKIVVLQHGWEVENDEIRRKLYLHPLHGCGCRGGIQSLRGVGDRIAVWGNGEIVAAADEAVPGIG